MPATAETRSVFEAIVKKYGFLPNLLKEFGETAPAVLELYLAGSRAMEKSSLNNKERNAVMLAVSAANGCRYCTAVHSTMLQAAGLSLEDIKNINQGAAPRDERLAAIVGATKQILQLRGWLKKPELTELEAKGVNKTLVYEIIALIGLKTITNYVNHINGTEIDSQFQRWSGRPATKWAGCGSTPGGR